MLTNGHLLTGADRNGPKIIINYSVVYIAAHTGTKHTLKFFSSTVFTILTKVVGHNKEPFGFHIIAIND